MTSTSAGEFDLKPDPRILPMLGEINLHQWRCLAELIDNSIDGFLSVLRAGGSLDDPQIIVNTPMANNASARVTVSDNGPGMTPDRLELAVRAGWSGNNPIDSLGMFGMGFNIATARLGTVTTVWTSQAGDAEEHGLRIDFDTLRKQGSFKTPRLTRPKTDPARSGTSITIERLKPDQREWFSKPANRSRAKKELARAYSAMLRANGVPMSYKLVFNTRRVRSVEHCAWADTRSVDTSRHGTVFAVQKVNQKLPDRKFCTACWQWLGVLDSVCPACQAATSVVERERHVHGWIGLQRYLSSTSYGFDFIRNGRKIEMGNRDLFFWRDPNSDAVELEYPIDDVRQRGRFVGEIHLDHCRVTYMKDRFDRTDPAWDEMTAIVRGQGPLQPRKAASLGYTSNQSPLFNLYQAFRRSSPPNARVAGGWKNVIAVKDNDRAEEMAKKFSEGVPEYQPDDKWWELVEEEDNKLLTPPTGTGGGDGSSSGGSGGGGIPGFGGGTPGGSGGATGGRGTSTGGAAPTPAPPAPPPPPRTQIASLSREYRHDGTSLRWDVKAFDVHDDDPGLRGPEEPWSYTRQSDGGVEVLINTAHSVFRSATMTESDAVLCELAFRAADFSRDQSDPPSFARILAELRDRYAGPMKLNPVAMANGAEMLFRTIARAWNEGIESDDAAELFGELPTEAQKAIHHKMAARSVPNPQKAISDGRFLEYATPSVIVDFVVAHPELFFDGRCWDDTYSELDYSHASATAEAQRRVLGHYEALLRDTLWLSDVDPDDLELVPRERVLRAMLAIDLLAPTGSGEDG